MFITSLKIGSMLNPLVLLSVIILAASPASGKKLAEGSVDVKVFGNLSAAKSHPATTGKTLVISDVQTCGNLTVPPDRTLSFVSGGILNVKEGKTVVLNGPLEAAITRIFMGKGDVSVRESYPQWWGIKDDGSAKDDTPLFIKAVKALQAHGTLRIPKGVYIGAISVRKSNISIVGDGSTITTIKMPLGIAGNVLELGDTASGNDAAAYENLNISGLTFDGNKDHTLPPSDDLTGWGMPCTMISHSTFSDIRAENCWNGGIGFFINSNYNTGEGFHVYNCSGKFGEPGFDINSSKYNSFTGIISKSCQYGVRLLDNCWNNHVEAHIENAVVTGFVYGNQTVNESHNNDVTLTIENGTSINGIQIGANCRNSVINATITNIYGGGLYVIKQPQSVNDPSGNVINVFTRHCSLYSATIDGNNNIVSINSVEDNRVSTSGNNYAVLVGGNYNKITASIVASPASHIRGIKISDGATENEIEAIQIINCISGIDDFGRNSRIKSGKKLQ